MAKRNGNSQTEHGKNIAMQIQTTDAYGTFNNLTAADVWNIVDNLNTHFVDHTNEALIKMTAGWLLELESAFPDLETV